MTPDLPPQPMRILFVFAWLVVGGEETEVRLLAQALDRARYRIDVVACFRKPGMSDQVHHELDALGIDVDRTPYTLSFEDTVDYLSAKLAGYDVIVSCQNVADIYPALAKLHWRPPLIEHGGLVSEALAGPKHFTSRYVGVCQTIRDAAASRMPGRESHALEIPSMVDLSAFDPAKRAATRASLGVGGNQLLIGWVGRLDQKKRVEDFIEAAALLAPRQPSLRFVVVGGPDAFMPDYAISLRRLAAARGLEQALIFLGDRPDVPLLLGAMDIFAWLSRGEGMPHVIAEAGAAALPVVATPDNGALQQIEDGVSGLFVPHEAPAAVAEAIERLVLQPDLRTRLGKALRLKVETTYAVDVVVPQWTSLFDAVLAERTPAPAASVFESFIQGGFECSTHKRRDGEARRDLIEGTGHGANAAGDYIQLKAHGLRTVRDGLRWHLIEPEPGRYDWSSFLPMLRASRAVGTQVIWDLMHYGWPEDLDIWQPDFVVRFTAYAEAAARVVKAETTEPPFYCPINEISFHAWAGGDATYLNPFCRGRGFELKAQLCRAAISAMKAILAVDPRARFVHCEPAINVIADRARPEQRGAAEGTRLAQFQAFDMIGGMAWPLLGGEPHLLDIVGINYYFNNQWIHGGPTIDETHRDYKPLRAILAEAYARYGRPLLISETGIEGDLRESWFRTVVAEVDAARAAGIPVEGICLYPIINHPGWDDDRDCPSGLLDVTVRDGARSVHAPLARAIDALTRSH